MHIGLCSATLWQRESFYRQIDCVEENLKETLEQFSRSFSTLVREDLKFETLDSKLDETVFTFRKVNLPKLNKDNGEEIATKEIEKMVDSAEEMIKLAEEGSFVKAGIIFAKQIISSARVIFELKPGETRKKDKKFAWLFSQNLLQVSIRYVLHM